MDKIFETFNKAQVELSNSLDSEARYAGHILTIREAHLVGKSVIKVINQISEARETVGRVTEGKY